MGVGGPGHFLSVLPPGRSQYPRRSLGGQQSRTWRFLVKRRYLENCAVLGHYAFLIYIVAEAWNLAENTLSPPGITPWTFQPVVSRNTDYATQVPSSMWSCIWNSRNVKFFFGYQWRKVWIASDVHKVEGRMSGKQSYKGNVTYKW